MKYFIYIFLFSLNVSAESICFDKENYIKSSISMMHSFCMAKFENNKIRKQYCDEISKNMELIFRRKFK